ncbi:MAG: hypothetical protein LBH06_02985 [Rikenellaceae bacterium]|nr:hypothetical protein [Rikenellaceae bacterium]
MRILRSFATKNHRPEQLGSPAGSAVARAAAGDQRMEVINNRRLTDRSSPVAGG